jgi:branched-chain amino acid aminotransferase
MMNAVDPTTTVYFNNRFVPLHDAHISILTHALHYGTGVFEGIRGYWDAEETDILLLRPQEHFARWKKNCSLLRIEVGPSPAELAAITADVVRRNRFATNLYIRPLAYKSAERIGIATNDENAFAIVAFPVGDYLDSAKGLHAGVSSWRRIEDNAIPARGKICGAYVNGALASDDARRAGFDEAIFLTEQGHVAEGASSNIFLVRNGRLITPPGTENILEGITRDCVIEIARRELHLDVIERPVDRSELYICDECFLTGTAVEIAPIVRVDHRAVGSGTIGPVTTELRHLYQQAVRGRIEGYRHWLMHAYASALVSITDDSLWAV